MAKKGKFDEASAKRIAAVVRRVEAMPISKARRTGKGANTPPDGFWARLTARAYDLSNKYSWEAIEPQSDITFDNNTDWREGAYDDSELYAVQINNAAAYAHATKGAIVWLSAAPGQPYYVFEGGQIYDRISATVDSAFTLGDSSVTGDNILALRGTSPLDDPSDIDETLTLYNDFAFNGDANSFVLAEYDYIQNHWIIVLNNNCGTGA